MPLTNRAVCRLCGVALIGAAVAHVCIADSHGHQSAQESVIALPAHLGGSHEDRRAESDVDLAVFARQVVAAATSSDAPPPMPRRRSSDEAIMAHWYENM